MRTDKLPRRAETQSIANDPFFILTQLSLPFHTICEWRCKTYESCSVRPRHLDRIEITHHIDPNTGQRVTQPCVPPSLNLRHLPLALDVRDENKEGECPVCAGRTPGNSSN